MCEEKRPESNTETLRLILGGHEDLAGVYDLIRKQFPRRKPTAFGILSRW